MPGCGCQDTDARTFPRGHGHYRTLRTATRTGCYSRESSENIANIFANSFCFWIKSSNGFQSLKNEVLKSKMALFFESIGFLIFFKWDLREKKIYSSSSRKVLQKYNLFAFYLFKWRFSLLSYYTNKIVPTNTYVKFLFFNYIIILVKIVFLPCILNNKCSLRKLPKWTITIANGSDSSWVCLNCVVLVSKNTAQFNYWKVKNLKAQTLYFVPWI